MYDPTIGRFISEDPIGLLDDVNSYRYVHNSPPNGRDPTGLWNESGHFYTVYVVSRLAGHNHKAARELAYFAQYMDEVNAYDAAFMGLKHSSSTWKAAASQVATASDNLNDAWEEDVQTVLHQLHGGDEAAINVRRHHLSRLFQEAMGENDVKSAGIILHSFGDAFAHTYRENGNWSAFGTRIGHARGAGPLTGEVKGGHAVDQIRERFADGAYPEYVRQLADVLGIPEDNCGESQRKSPRQRLDELLKRMEPKLVGKQIQTKSDGREYSDDLEIELLRTFSVSDTLVAGKPDTYLNNELAEHKVPGRGYFPENGQRLGFGGVTFHDMRAIVRKMREEFAKPWK